MHTPTVSGMESRAAVDASDVHHSRASTSDGKHAATVECPQCGSRISEGREGLTDGLECGTDQRVVADINECIRRATGQLETVLSLLYQEDDDDNHPLRYPCASNGAGDEWLSVQVAPRSSIKRVQILGFSLHFPGSLPGSLLGLCCTE